MTDLTPADRAPATRDTHVPGDYRIKQTADERGHQLHCDRCGQLPMGPSLTAGKARARRHAAANPEHHVWMAHTVMTHFVAARQRTA